MEDQTIVAMQTAPSIQATPSQVGNNGSRRQILSRLRNSFIPPPGYPNVMSWFMTAVSRNRRGLVGALITTWFNLPFAFFGAVAGMAAGASAGYLGTLTENMRDWATPLLDLPVLGAALDTAVLQGGMLGAFLGAGLGVLGGFVAGLIYPWLSIFSDDPLRMIGIILGQLISAVVFGVLYSLYRVGAEGWLLRVSGYRPPSRRETEFLSPILEDCAGRLGLTSLPDLLIDDSREPNAYAATRHIVVTRGLLDEFDYSPEPIAAVLCHELTHWRNADALSDIFIRGVALPLYLLYSAVSRLRQLLRKPFAKAIIWLISFPLQLCIRYVVMPMQAAGSRLAEYTADQAAVAAGYRAGLRLALVRIGSLDGPRNGWEQAVCATHPPTETRLEAIEAPGRKYLLAAAEPPEDLSPAPPSFADVRRRLVTPRVIGPSGYFAIAMTTAASLALWGGIFILQDYAFSPQSALRNYFASLDRRDLNSALSYTTEHAAGRQYSALLEADPVSRSEYKAPTDLDIEAIPRPKESASGGSAKTRVARLNYRIGGSEYSASVRLVRDNQTVAFVLHKWRLDEGLYPVTVTVPPTVPIQINGVAVKSRQASDLQFDLPPGGYSIGVAENPIFEEISKSLYVKFEALPVEINPAIKHAAEVAVDEQVKAYIDECAASTSPAPEGCPFEHPYYSYYSDDVTATWTITEYPTVMLSVDPEEGLVKFTTEIAGMATAQLSASDSEPYEVEINLSGVVVVRDGEVIATPNVD